ncbi:hypothetical protein A2U01_0061161, partial [Trifolium medium]|nr:hypothetical protein [Trifolium medium]
RVASRPSKPVEVVSDITRRPAPGPGRRVPGSIIYKPSVEKKRKTPVVVIGKGKAISGEDDVLSSRKKAVKCLGGSSTALPLPIPLVEV